MQYGMKVTRKVVRLFELVMVAVLGSLPIATTFAEDAALQQMLPLYKAPPASNPAAVERSLAEREQRFTQLQSGAYGKPEDFTAKARVAFKTDKRPMVADARVFTMHPSVPLPDGWRSEGALYVWPGDAEHSLPLLLPVAPGKEEKPFRPGDFEEFWLDYAPSPGIQLCTPQMEFRVEVHPYNGDSKAGWELVARTIKSFTPSALKARVTIDAAQAVWKEKDYGYLARRVLGVTPDEDWRYTQDQKNGVLQRRLHVQVDDVEDLEIALSQGVSVERVNLHVSHKDDYGAGELVEFAGLPQNPTLPDGRPGVRLNLREALEKRFPREWVENAKEPGRYHFYLQEVFVFVPGEARALAAAKAVRSLALLAQEPGAKTQDGYTALQRQTLASNVLELNPFRRRMVVDLRKLTEKGEADLKKAALLLLPPPGATSCAIRIDGVRAVSAYNGSVPVFARRVEDWSPRRGGVFSVVSPQHDQVENPGIIGYLPLSMLTVPDVRQDGAVEVVMKIGANNQIQLQPLPVQALPLPYRIAGPNGKEVAPDKAHLVSSAGAVLGVEGVMPRAAVEGDLLVLEGRSGALEIAWPLAAHINEKTWFYFGVAEGIEQIGGITLTLDLADRGVIKRRVVPNQRLHLVTGETEVRNLRLRIFPAASSYRYKLREIALFAPSAASYAQAFAISLPIPYNVTPKPELQPTRTPVLEVQPGHVAGLAAGLTASVPLRFSTALEPALDWVRGVRLKYRLPPSYGDGEACPLTLQFNWANGKTERQVCFEKPDGTLFIPMANWLGGADKPKNLGVLQSIDWVLRPATGADRGIAESFDLQFSVEGWAMLSAADHLRLSPLFNAAHFPVLADAGRANELASGLYAQKIWLPLEEKTLSRMLAAKGQIQPAKHWLFTLEQVVAEPKQLMSWERWRELTEPPPTPYAPPRSPKWLAWASTMLLAWATWKKGWWSLKKVWVLGKGAVKTLCRALRWVLGVDVRWVWRWLPRLNVVIGVLALGPGLWLAGRYGLGFAGVMLLAAAGLVAWAAYCHWREQAVQPWPGSPAAMRIRLGVLAVTLGCALWSLGKYNLSAEALWGFLPLFAAIYALAPAFYRLGQQLVLRYRRYLSLCGWLVLTGALYGLGLLVKVGSGDNYFFTFGGLAAVFALRAGLLGLEPRCRKLFPTAAERVYGGAGSLYFSGALAMLVATAMVLSVKLDPIAEQLAIVVYYCLVIGTVKEIWALRTARQAKTADEESARVPAGR